MYPAAMLSASRSGIIACGVSPDYTVDELAHALTVSKASCLIATENNWQRACGAADKVGLARDRILCFDEVDGDPSRRSIRSLIRATKERGDASLIAPFQLPPGKTTSQVCAYLGFSSGTTGLPKGVMISHANVIAQCLQVLQLTTPDLDQILAALPFYHITGVMHQLHLPMVLNANVYVLSGFTMERMLRTVEKYKIKELLLVPPILIRLVRERDLVKKYDLSHVRRFTSGAAPLSNEILGLLEKQFPGTGFKQAYGMTESCSCVTLHPPSMYSYRYASRVGGVVASTEVRIVDPETNRDCSAGQPGEIWARGPQITMGYIGNPQATAETFDADGFLHTGDIGYFDSDGLLSVTDRIKEMIKVKGIAVAPAEIENLLLGHPDVVDCAVCGIPDERAGERPKAFVVLHPRHNQSQTSVARDLIEYVKSNKTRHKWISEVEVINEIPKSAAGKILRKKFRQPDRQVGLIVREEKTSSSRL
ncbi:Acyl-CoA synthetase (AMP-forming)/AMP-acid ligase II [Geosmithia morbida]|uniref:Acyl-CoA synthetase (AMP-forming)/AMP-acid ligase II n=1 Tax=Geosmithia morbida TaxID=1094350 RepID=A0A9P4YPA9_9HYPO|nr:Acyl-CoA synthetase (AMP-forming)/AMP-acid ligase II [Geosmithia morbida]KAF4119560.1 Acyl-CoA synthetase (AMP-forming)/AMP-acid ligase II [Geosmithia morbida]